MLTERQLLTLKHLKDAGYENPEQVIAWCKKKLVQTRANTLKSPGKRRHSHKYYKELIAFLSK